MDRRRILFTKPGCAEVVTEPVPELRCGEVLVKLAVSTISSGTERALLTGDANISVREQAGEVRFPRSSGYSSSGTVVAVGDGVTSVRPGCRVAMRWSSHSEYVVIREQNVIEIGEADFAEAALWHIATFSLAAIRKCRLEPGESAVVMGMGALGMMAVQLLRMAGAVPIIAVAPGLAKREKALEIGADYALDPYAPDFAATVKELTDGGARVAIEVAGNGRALDGVLDCMAPFGRVALLGCTRDSDFTIDYYRKVHGPGITLVGAHTNARPEQESAPGWWTAQDDMLALKKLNAMGRIRLADLVEETHPPQNAPEVYARLATERGFPLVQFDWRRLDETC